MSESMSTTPASLHGTATARPGSYSDANRNRYEQAASVAGRARVWTSMAFSFSRLSTMQAASSTLGRNFGSASLAPVTSGAQRVHYWPPREDAVRQSQKEVNTSTRDLTVRLRTHTGRYPLDVMNAMHTAGMILDPRGRAESVHLAQEAMRRAKVGKGLSPINPAP